MQVKRLDRIHYNRNHFEPNLPAVPVDSTVVKVAIYDTGFGEYEEYLTEAGDWVSELQLVAEDLA